MSLDWNALGLVGKVSLGDTVWGNYSYLANGIKKGHKTAHAAKYDEVLNSGDSDLISEYMKSCLRDKSNAYGSEEEEQVVTKTEQSVAKKHGEIRKNQVTRKGHKGGSFIPILNNEEPSGLSKIIFEHNNLL